MLTFIYPVVEGPGQVEIECACVDFVCIYKGGGPVEIHSSTSWNLMGCTMAVLWPNSILLLPSSRFALSPVRKTSVLICSFYTIL